jgi:hypothetical protein
LPRKGAFCSSPWHHLIGSLAPFRLLGRSQVMPVLRLLRLF